MKKITLALLLFVFGNRATAQDWFRAPKGYTHALSFPDIRVAFEVYVNIKHPDSAWIGEVENPALALHCLLYHPGCYFPGARVIVNRGAVCRFLEKKYGLRAIDAREHVDGY